MREENIEKMNFKELRAEVQLLRDEFAIFKRKYEDAIYNLDSTNFGKSFTAEQNNMRSQIRISADAIKTMVSTKDLETKLENYSTIEQTSDAIHMVVSKGADRQNAEAIDDLSEATDTTKVYVIRGEDDEVYYYYNGLMKQWEQLSNDSIYTVFNQTADGFSLKGNVVIDGETVVTKNLTLSGNVTWDMENSPVKTQYSADGIVWHEIQTVDDMYMHMSFDGGHTWSTPPTKVVGTDGRDGTDGIDGSDAEVTPQNVFNALTDNGAAQGMFAAFVNDNNRLFINAEYIQAGVLRGQTIQSFMSSENYGYGTYAELNGDAGSLDFYYKPSGSSPEQRFTMYQQGGMTYIRNIDSTLYIGNYPVTGQSTNTTYPIGSWNFTNATVTGLSSIAVFG